MLIKYGCIFKIRTLNITGHRGSSRPKLIWNDLVQRDRKFLRMDDPKPLDRRAWVDFVLDWTTRPLVKGIIKDLDNLIRIMMNGNDDNNYV